MDTDRDGGARAAHFAGPVSFKPNKEIKSSMNCLDSGKRVGVWEERGAIRRGLVFSRAVPGPSLTPVIKVSRPGRIFKGCPGYHDTGCHVHEPLSPEHRAAAGPADITYMYIVK